MEDRVMLNNSQRKKQEVEDHHRNVRFSNNKMSVTACNDSLNAKTLNVNFVCVTCGKYVLNENHDKCVLHYLNGVMSRTKMSMAVPISTREPKRIVNQSIATTLRRTVASESTNQKPRHTTRKLYEKVSNTCSWWYPKFTPPGYKWKPKSQIGNVNPNVSMPLENASRTVNILEPMTPRCSTVSNTTLYSNSFAAQKFLGSVKFGNDQIEPILGYGDLVQGTVTIKRVYYVEGLNHNLFFAGQFYDADLEVAFRKSTCYIHDLKGNDLLTASRGTDLYSITLQDTSSPNPICLMAKATSSQAWLWHRCISHLNFDTINLLSKNDIVIGLPQLKFVKDHLCSSSIATTCFTQNRSLVIPRHEKTPYHIINDRKPSVKYFHIIGSLCYIVRDGENLDKMKEIAKPTEKHLTTVKWVIRYLKDTIHMGLLYPKDTGFELTAFSDSDHAGCLDSCKSTSGGIQFLDCGFYFDKIPMYYDSKEAIAISCNLVQHSRAKHIDVRYHFIKEKVEKGIVDLFFARTEYQLPDLFTKALSEDSLKYLVRRLGMRCLTPEELEVLANEST
nr:integrase, catalytic region, zinc finger, CCHC-type, peptidase aspartic, catalytic [Tanacetum cinerariifolium]